MLFNLQEGKVAFCGFLCLPEMTGSAGQWSIKRLVMFVIGHAYPHRPLRLMKPTVISGVTVN